LRDSRGDGQDLLIELNSNSFFYVLTINNSNHTGSGVVNLITKSFFFKEDFKFLISDLAFFLKKLGIKKLNLFHIKNDKEGEKTKPFIRKFRLENCGITFYALSIKDYLEILAKCTGAEFTLYNPYSLYILENGNYTDLKRMLTNIGGIKVDIVRGSSQKAHILSPLEIRLSFYISAMLECHYTKISYINSFNTLDKNRYLPIVNNRNKNK
jgi:hypothetical protein